MATITLNINKQKRIVNVEPDTPLLWVLRDTLGLTGTKFGCGVGQCGACTIHLDGEAMISCQLNAGEYKGKSITTIEGLAANRSHPLQKAWIAEDVPQCGYCQSGQIMAAAALFKRSPKPSEAEAIEALSNICRCGTYARIRQAVRILAKA